MKFNGKVFSTYYKRSYRDVFTNGKLDEKSIKILNFCFGKYNFSLDISNTFTHTHTHSHALTHTHTHTHTHTYIYVCVCVCVCVLKETHLRLRSWNSELWVGSIYNYLLILVYTFITCVQISWYIFTVLLF